MVYKREITVQGGSGGDGCVSFRREKYLPLGGYGGNVIIAADSNLVDLSGMGWKKEFVAGSGSRGSDGRKRGKRGEDLAISVPAGTLIFTTSKSGEQIVLADLRTHGQKLLVVKGGRGGLGNARFATAVNQAPKTASQGQPGAKRDITLEVKIVTDICIVGHPNSGKSTLLSAISRARPEIADYPFATRQPVLGVMVGDKRDFIVAEIPGLVEGAHLGKGLGNEFLRHAERTKLLIYLLDGGSPAVIDDFKTLDQEITLYKGLAHKPKIVAVNKVDLPEVQVRLPQIKRYLSKHEAPVFYISALDGQAVLELTRKAMDMVEQASREEDMISQAEIAIFRPRPRK
jgi:GTP-binding protein